MQYEFKSSYLCHNINCYIKYIDSIYIRYLKRHDWVKIKFVKTFEYFVICIRILIDNII